MNADSKAVSRSGSFRCELSPSLIDFDSANERDFKLAGALDYDIGGQAGKLTFPAVTLGANPRASLSVGLLGFNWPAPAFRVLHDNVALDLK